MEKTQKERVISMWREIGRAWSKREGEKEDGLGERDMA